MTFIYPDLEWYISISKREDASPRCPYANAHRCPRYYSSLYLLGDAGITTKMQSEKIKQLDIFWDKTDVLPVVAEHDTGIAGSGRKTSGYYNFCPEISFDVFSLFANSLDRYTDEIDRDAAHSFLQKEAHTKDWRWQWEHVSPLHYLECPVYSQLLTQYVASPMSFTNEELMEIKPSFVGISINVKILLTRFAKWWLKKRRQ